MHQEPGSLPYLVIFDVKIYSGERTYAQCIRCQCIRCVRHDRSEAAGFSRRTDSHTATLTLCCCLHTDRSLALLVAAQSELRCNSGGCILVAWLLAASTSTTGSPYGPEYISHRTPCTSWQSGKSQANRLCGTGNFMAAANSAPEAFHKHVKLADLED